MKKLFYGIALFILLISCKEQTQKIDSIADPNQFVGKHKAKAMVLGVFHFGNAGIHSYTDKFSFDALEDGHQKELDALLEKIVKYKPTKILLESNRIKADSILNTRYQDYLKGNYDISNKRSEDYQIGFKLAKKLGHARIYCSDASAEWFGADLDWDNYDDVAYLKSHGQYEKSRRYDYESFYQLEDSLKTTQTLLEHLAMINSPNNALKSHQSYLTETILEGAGDNYIGADAVAKWYRRNLRIFANTYDLTNFEQEERILLIYGSSHIWQLRQFFIDSPDYEYIEPNLYLVD